MRKSGGFAPARTGVGQRANPSLTEVSGLCRYRSMENTQKVVWRWWVEAHRLSHGQ